MSAESGQAAAVVLAVGATMFARGRVCVGWEMGGMGLAVCKEMNATGLVWCSREYSTVVRYGERGLQ